MNPVKNFLKSRVVFIARQIVNKNAHSSVPQDTIYKYIRIPLYRFIHIMVVQQLNQELIEKIYTIKKKRIKKR